MIKTTVTLLVLALLMLSVSSCKKADQELERMAGEIQFRASIVPQLQASTSLANTFERDDAIGIFMFTSGQTLSQTQMRNRRYVFGASEVFSAQENSERLFFPGQGRVDFVAYYPYQDGVSSSYLINVADQSDLRAIDLLRASTTEVDGSGVDDMPNLLFRHELSKVVFNITGTGVALNGLSVRFNNINTRASFDLGDALVSGNSAPANVLAHVSPNGSTAEAILLPGEMGGQTITFSAGNTTFTTTMPAGLIFAPGTRYIYNVLLQGDGQGLVEVEIQQSAVADWIDVLGDPITLFPDEGVPIDSGVEQLLYEELFGTTPTIATALIGNYTGYTAAGFANGTISYSNVGADVGFGDIRSTPTISPSLWLPANRYVTFQAAGLDAANASNLRLTFDIAASAATLGNAQNVDNNIITVNFNGTSYSLPPIVFTTNNGFVPVSIPLTASGTANSILQLLSEFDATTNTGNTVGVRVDNIRLYGMR